PFRHTALGVPGVGSAALGTTTGARTWAGRIRSHLATAVPAGAAVVGVSPTILAARIRVADTARRDAIAAALRQDPAIAVVTRNRLLWLDETARAFRATAAAAAAALRTIPNDPAYPFQAWHYGLIDLPRAWSITKGSSAVLVAVVDDGIRFDHPGIAANLAPDGYDFVSAADSLPLCSGGMISNAADGDGPDPDPTIPASYSLDSTGTCFAPDELGAHGLHVAGTLGAVGNVGFGDSTDRGASTAWAFSTASPDYAFFEGTSMAPPHVAGVAALVLSQTPSLTAAALRSRLTSYATGPESPYGAGLVNAYNS